VGEFLTIVLGSSKYSGSLAAKGLEVLAGLVGTIAEKQDRLAVSTRCSSAQGFSVKNVSLD
jgi:hypothetical protein